MYQSGQHYDIPFTSRKPAHKTILFVGVELTTNYGKLNTTAEIGFYHLECISFPGEACPQTTLGLGTCTIVCFCMQILSWPLLLSVHVVQKHSLTTFEMAGIYKCTTFK